MKTGIGSALFISASLMAYCSAASGQIASTEPQDRNAADAEAVKDIIVTGSRLVTNGASAPTPVSVVTNVELQQRAPTNIADALNQLPQFAGSTSNNKTTWFAGADVKAGNYLNLRNLDTRRVLVLLDGVRVPPTATSGGVDVNVLPQALIQRVDVVTGGASAAYGSDAVSGVVNYILNKNFKGLKASVQAGISRYGDAGSQKLSFAAGESFMDDRLHLIASGEYFKMDGLVNEDRPLGRKLYTATGVGTAANPITTLADVRYAIASFGGLIVGGPLNGRQFGPGGTVIPFNPGTPTGTGGFNVGGDGAYFIGSSATAGLETKQLFSRLGFDVTPDLEFHVQGLWSRSETVAHGLADARFPNGAAAVTIFSGNAFLPADVQSQLGTTPSFQLGRYIAEEGAFTSNNRNDFWNINVGFDGTIGSSWRWDASYNYGRSVLNSKNHETSTPKLLAAVDAVRDGSGNIVCRVTLTNPGLYPGCVPINLFGPGSASPEAVAYIGADSVYRIFSSLSTVNANIRGDLLDLGAGPVAVAVGGEYRVQKLGVTSNGDPARPFDRTGLRGVPATALMFRSTNVGSASGEVKVKEGYAEILVPILKDSAIGKSLDINAAARITDYSTSGTVKTWKVGTTYAPMDSLRFRATLSRDIAAPTLYQLFSGASARSGFAVDVHTGVSGNYTIINSGNSDLKPERATTFTGGVVFQPEFASGLTVTVDYYNIKIDDAIQTPVNSNQDCEASNGTSPACANVIRPFPFSDRSPANFHTALLTKPINIATLKRSGIDLDVSYRTSRLVLRGLFSYLIRYKTQDSLASPVIDLTGAGRGNGGSGAFFNPRLTGTISIDYIGDKWRLGGVARGFTTTKNDPTRVFANYGKQPGYVYFDVNGSMDIGPIQPFFSVQNLLDKKPPINPFNINPGLQFPTYGALYDIIGRYMTVGVRMKL